VLSRTGEHLRSDQQAVLPHAMARYITEDLESVKGAARVKGVIEQGS